MECTTFSHIDEDTGEAVMKNKIPYATLREANMKAKLLNIQPTRIKMLGAYKCSKCHKFHIGKNGKNITEEYRKKTKKKVRLKGLTIIGKIDLTPYAKGNQKL